MFKAHAKRSAFTYVLSNRILDQLDRFPRAYYLFLKVRHGRKAWHHRVVSKKHRITIEAFPRSGSSFAVQAFLSANSFADGCVATHMHRSSHVIISNKYKVPTVVFYREPGPAVKSLLAMFIEQGDLPDLTESQIKSCLMENINRYINFYTRLEDVSGILFIPFEKVINDFGQVIVNINDF